MLNASPMSPKISVVTPIIWGPPLKAVLLSRRLLCGQKFVGGLDGMAEELDLFPYYVI